MGPAPHHEEAGTVSGPRGAGDKWPKYPNRGDM